MLKKPKDLIASERKERGHGKGMGVYATLLQSDTVHPHGHTKTDTSPVGVEMCKKPKDLIASEREEHGYGKGVCVYGTLLSDTVHPYGLSEADTSPVGSYFLL